MVDIRCVNVLYVRILETWTKSSGKEFIMECPDDTFSLLMVVVMVVILFLLLLLVL